MFKKFKNIIFNREVQKKIGFTVFIFMVYRLGCILTVPGVNKDLLSISSDSIFSIMNLFSGGSLANFSIFALGVGPFITSSIVTELLSDVIPVLSEWKEEGEKGRKKAERLNRYFGCVLAIVQGWSITYAFNHQYGLISDPSISSYMYIIVMLVAGTTAISWLADQITLRGIGNGMSMIIFAGIVAELPNTFIGNFNATITSAIGTDSLTQGVVHFVGFTVLYLLLVLGVVCVESAEKRIPIMASAKLSNGTTSSYMPIKVNPAGVIPIIFAQSIITVPQTVISFFNQDLYTKVSSVLSFGSWSGIAIYCALTFLMTFFYTSVVLDKEDLAANFKKQGFFIPGVHTGKDTEKALSLAINRTTLVGAVALTVMAGLPYILAQFASVTSTAALGGTGIIVAVGVAIETINGISTLQMENRYERIGWF